MKVVEANPKQGSAILPGADFADAWRVVGLSAGLDAQKVALRFFDRSPRWIRALLWLRNLLVRPFGLRTRTSDQATPRLKFPVISSQPNRVVLGFDDRHLDFRVVIDIEAAEKERLSATATTYVRTHNLGGRLYLRVIKPFHRAIVPVMLANATKT